MPVLQYRCQVWGMHVHSLRVAAANHARFDLQRLYDYYFGTNCDLLPSTPCKILLAELGLLPLQVFWLQQSLHFWNSLAALPAGSFVCEILLTDNLTDAFCGGACSMASSLAGCLHSLGHRVCDVIPILNVGNIDIVGALAAQLQDPDMCNGALYCPCMAPTWGVAS